MLVFDHLLLSPMRGLLRVFREIGKAVEQECESEGDAIRTELRELYMRLETHQISEAEFDAAETALLDRLERVEPRNTEADDETRTDG